MNLKAELKDKLCKKCGKTWSVTEQRHIEKLTQNRVKMGGRWLMGNVFAIIFLGGIGAAIAASEIDNKVLITTIFTVLSLVLVIVLFVKSIRAFNAPLHMFSKMKLTKSEQKHKRSFKAIKARMGYVGGAIFALSFIFSAYNGIRLESFSSALITTVVVSLIYVVFAFTVHFFQSLSKQEPCWGCRTIFKMTGYNEEDPSKNYPGTILPTKDSGYSLENEDWMDADTDEITQTKDDQ